MGNKLNPVKRTLVIKAGMTPQDVINSKKATPQQKKMAYIFDSDGVAGYSQREADVFNATLIADRGKNGVSLWTRCKDNSKKETKFIGDVASFKYAPKGNVKPYVVAKKQTVATSKIDKTKSYAIQIVQRFEQTGKGELKVETYDNGNIKTKNYHDKNDNNRVSQAFYRNGNLKSEKATKWTGSGYTTMEETNYYPNGKVQKRYTIDANGDNRLNEEFYESGKPKYRKAAKWTGSGYITMKETNYYSNGKVQKRYTTDANNDNRLNEEFYESGKPKSKIIETWDDHARFAKGADGQYRYYGDYVETTHIEYDSNGNVIKNAKVTK